jgi:hypothetical protein
VRASALVPRTEEPQLRVMPLHECSSLSFIKNSLSSAEAYAMEIPVSLLPNAKPVGLTSTELFTSSEDRIFSHWSGFLIT